MGNRLPASKRKAIRKRDNYTCAICRHRDVDSNGNAIELQIHHIVPYQYAIKFLKWSRDEANNCFNLITLCSLCHGGDRYDRNRFCVHPDFIEIDIGKHIRSLEGKDYDKALKRLEDPRQNMAELGIKYWRDDKDLELCKIAKRNTKRFIQKHPWEGCNSLFSTQDEAYRVFKTIQNYILT